MDLKKSLTVCTLAFTLLGVTGCDTIQPDSPEDGQYSTQTSMSALEYSLYMSKQITVYTNQLTTRLTMIKNSKESTYENEAELAAHSVEVMKDVLNEVTVTLPSQGRDSQREMTIKTMQTAIGHMEDYIEDVKAGKDTSGYSLNFQNDFNELTGLANLYYE